MLRDRIGGRLIGTVYLFCTFNLFICMCCLSKKEIKII